MEEEGTAKEEIGWAEAPVVWWEHLVHQIRHMGVPNTRESKGVHDEERSKKCDFITYDDL